MKSETCHLAVVLGWCAVLLLCTRCASSKRVTETWDRNYWHDLNDAELKTALKKVNTNVAKNIVLAIGDGMGVTTTSAIRLYRGQVDDGLGEEAVLAWDLFPHVGMSKTYATDMMTVDSAASGTAYHSGVKTKYETVGVDDTVVRRNCSSVEGAKVTSILDWALQSGKSVGIVTTDALVGASPSSAYAHAAHRNWRTDGEIRADDPEGNCKDIARQLVEDNLNIKVMLGGGRYYFLPDTVADPEHPTMMGGRTDNKTLPQEWLESHRLAGHTAKYVIDKAGFDKATADNTDYLLGMFEPKRMQEEVDRRLNQTEPSIAEMVDKAIDILSKNPEGYYLFVEGANIDLGHHFSRAKMALEEGLAFNDAVHKVMEKTDAKETLVVVSADHSHAFSIGGYATRGQSILSVANNPYKDSKDSQGYTYTILSYGNGPGYVSDADRINYTDEYFTEDRVYQSPFPLSSETHGADDVQIFASGPMSHIFTGTHEQTFIAHGMAYAACIGRDMGHCDESATSSSMINMQSLPLLLINAMLMLIHYLCSQ